MPHTLIALASYPPPAPPPHTFCLALPHTPLSGPTSYPPPAPPPTFCLPCLTPSACPGLITFFLPCLIPPPAPPHTRTRTAAAPARPPTPPPPSASPFRIFQPGSPRRGPPGRRRGCEQVILEFTLNIGQCGREGE
ncbi:uncharacterized protein LOC134762721 [Penaeus indicus]|uniref:uncharacterized protein LOC134762721 n=1 Tax=Penaeus indicus TaxID=29960 RepID=UPI00300CAAEF